MQRRLDELQLRHRDVEDKGVSRAVLSQILNAKEDRYALSTLRYLSTALGWEVDAIERILDGDEDDGLRLLTEAYERVGPDARDELIRLARQKLDEAS